MNTKTVHRVHDSTWYTLKGGSTRIQPLPTASCRRPDIKNIFESQADMLEALKTDFFEKRASLPVEERFKGFEDSFKQKLLGIIKRLGYILRHCSIEKGLSAYQLSLSNRAYEMLKHSIKPVRNFQTTLMPQFLKEGADRQWPKLTTNSYWHYNGPRTWKDMTGNELQAAFKDGDQTIFLHNTVTSSGQTARDTLANARRIEDETTGKTIAYTGRPDTEAKAIEQIEWMFRSEFKSKNPRGLTKQDDGSYTLTYVVSNLMSASRLSYLGGFDEKEAVLREEEVLRALSQTPLIIDGKTVHVKPLYFTEAVNAVTMWSSLSTQTKINQRGLAALRTLAGNDCDSLVTKALDQLENPDLLPEEALFYRALIAKHLNLGEVTHCRSSNSRTAIGLAISAALQGWLNLKCELPPIPHEVLSNPDFKEIYIEHLIGSLPVTHQACSTDWKMPPSGFSWGGNSSIQNPTALRMLPDEFKEEGNRPFLIRIGLVVLHLFDPLFKRKINTLEKTHPDQAFKLDDSHFFLEQSEKV
ncbi:hypothetical protein [Candidatus Neptunochlamydia vexilliferae]|nr:hypothetical protein [Candidatus Neptunochlamydia vexilliferae]